MLSNRNLVLLAGNLSAREKVFIILIVKTGVEFMVLVNLISLPLEVMTLDKLTGTYEKFWVFLCSVKFVSSIAVWKKAHELVTRCELGCFCLFCSWRFHAHGLSLVTGCLTCCRFSLKGALLQEAVGRDGEQNASSRTEGPQEQPRKPEGKRKEGIVTQ